MPRFIVLAGKKQAGKTTSANYLRDKLLDWRRDLSIQVVSFATPIKEFCQNVMGLTEAQIYGSDAEKNSDTLYRWENLPDEIRWRYAIRPDVDSSYDHIMTQSLDRARKRSGYMTAREIMQIFGTDIMRNFFDFDIWANAPFAKEWKCVDYVIIDDCRFPNEADVAREHDALLIKLTRNTLGDDVHVSEKALDNYPQENYTHVIDNNEYDDINLLYKDLDKIVKAERYR
jgi:hypothetical protein